MTSATSPPPIKSSAEKQRKSAAALLSDSVSTPFSFRDMARVRSANLPPSCSLLQAASTACSTTLPYLIELGFDSFNSFVIFISVNRSNPRACGDGHVLSAVLDTSNSCMMSSGPPVVQFFAVTVSDNLHQLNISASKPFPPCGKLKIIPTSIWQNLSAPMNLRSISMPTHMKLCRIAVRCFVEFLLEFRYNFTEVTFL